MRRPATLALALFALFACTSPDPDRNAYQCKTDGDCGPGWKCAKTPAQTWGTCGKTCAKDADCAAEDKVCAVHVPPLDAKDTGGLCLPGRCNPRPEVCDGIDNDCNGLIDDGASCPAGSLCQGGKCTEVACDDGVDNDADGATDCADPDCDGKGCGPHGLTCAASACTCPGGGVETACGDGIDNDCDGLVDCADSDCAGLACGPGCTCAAGAKTETACGDGVDNDGDGKADCADSDCVGQGCATPDGGTTVDMNCSAAGACVPRESVCDDGVDNDGDGATDCADPDCLGQTCSPGKKCTAIGTCG